MKLSELADNPGAHKRRKRLGRGIGSGKGKTSGKGHKGTKARSGSTIKAFEGGQMPLHRRLPKRGFTNIFKREWAEVNLADLEKMFDAGATVTPESLVERGLVRRAMQKSVVILGQGELKKSLTVSAHRFSKSAKEKIEAAGGKAETIEGRGSKVEDRK